MQKGTERVKKVLGDVLGAPGATPAGRGGRTLLLGLVLCQATGFTLAETLSFGGGVERPIPLGIAFGVLFAATLLAVGHSQSKVAPSSGTSHLVSDFYQSLVTVFSNSSDDSSSSLKAASEVMALLLDRGMTQRSHLESHLIRKGYGEDDLYHALQQLEEAHLISVKANGVNVIPAKRRLFI